MIANKNDYIDYSVDWVNQIKVIKCHTCPANLAALLSAVSANEAKSLVNISINWIHA